MAVAQVFLLQELGLAGTCIRRQSPRLHRCDIKAQRTSGLLLQSECRFKARSACG